jgi:hypothetical protein
LARAGNLLCAVLLHLKTRRVTLAGITQHPTEEWMVQIARRLSMQLACAVNRHRYSTDAKCIDKLGGTNRKTELCGGATRAPILGPGFGAPPRSTRVIFCSDH